MSLKGDIAQIRNCTEGGCTACAAALARVEMVATELERLLAKLPWLIRELEDSPVSLYWHLKEGLPHIEAVLQLASEPGQPNSTELGRTCQAHGCQRAAKWVGAAENKGMEVKVVACDMHRDSDDLPLRP